MGIFFIFMVKGCKNSVDLRVLMIDGYIDEPGCLGVPPFLAPLPRYIAGAIRQATIAQDIPTKFLYCTIDQFRQNKKHYQEIEIDMLVLISGVTVPGKYLGGTPISYREINEVARFFRNSLTIFCGPAATYGIGEVGGRASHAADSLTNLFDLVIEGDADWAIFLFLTKHWALFNSLQILKRNNAKTSESSSIFPSENEFEVLKELCRIKRPNIHSLQPFAVSGPLWVIPQHPNFIQKPYGNLICEIETFQGCPRYRTGGCRFCIEPSKGPTQHRKIEDIVDEVAVLYNLGVKNFRLGSQTDFYAYLHGDYIHPKYPQPNTEAIKSLLIKIRETCPDLQTLHIDNVNALNFSLYPKESEEITKLIVENCTPGNIAAIGVESVDPDVIHANNLKATSEEIEKAVKIINSYGREVGNNGVPKFLPGLNFIMGLPGETAKSLDINYKFLLKLLKEGYQIRRINLRKFLVSTIIKNDTQKWVKKHLNKYQSKYFHWKAKIRDEIDHLMLQKIFPFGRTLKRVYTEKHEGNGTLARQIGTYPIRCFIPKKIPLYQYYDLKVVNHGSRSLICLISPIKLVKLSQKELEAIDGIGKARAQTIKLERPETEADWEKMDQKIQEIRLILEK